MYLKSEFDIKDANNVIKMFYACRYKPSKWLAQWCPLDGSNSAPYRSIFEYGEKFKKQKYALICRKIEITGICNPRAYQPIY